MKKILLISVNDDEKEKLFVKEFENIITSKGYMFLSIENTENLREAVKEADEIFTVFDAKIGRSYEFHLMAELLYQEKRKPVQIITSADEDNISLDYAKIAVEDAWNSLSKGNISDADMNFFTMYYSYKKKSFSYVDDFNNVEENDNKVLENFLES